MTHKREIQGVVVKRSGDKTASVLVTRSVLHPKYHKTVKRFKKYLIHDEKNELNVGVVLLLLNVDHYLKLNLLD